MGENRLRKWANNIESFRKIFTNSIWLIIIFIILSAIGRYLFTLRNVPQDEEAEKSAKYIPEQVSWEALDKAIVDALTASRDSAGVFISGKLDTWIASLMVRVDNDFLPWYFGYWNQQILGLKSLWNEGVYYFLDSHRDPAERITGEIQEEFAIRVLRPQIAQLEMERLSREAIDYYVAMLKSRLDEMPSKYNIPQPEWERYLEDISIMTVDTEGNREVPVSLKTIYVSGAGGAILLAGKVKVLLSKIGGKVAAKSAGKAAAMMAAKTGGKVAAKAGGKLLGPIIGIGIIVWDVADHYGTKADNMPILRQSIVDYFAEVKESLMNDSEAGILSTIKELEGEIVQSIRNKK